MHKYLKQHALEFFGVILFTFIKIISYNRFNILKGQLVDAAIGKIELGLKNLLLLFTIFLVASLTSSYILGLFRYSVKMNIMKDLKDDFLSSMLLRNRTAIHNLDTSKAISSYTAEMNLIDRLYLDMGGHLIEYIISIFITLATIAIIDWRMAIASVAVYVLPIFFTKAQQNKLTKAQSKFQEENDRHTDSFLQKLKGIEAIKNYHIESKIFELYNNSLNKLVDEDVQRAETRSRTNGLSSALTYFSQAIIAGLSAYYVFKGDISPGNFVSLFALSSAISSHIYWLARSVEAVLSAKPAVKSILDYINYSIDASSLVPVELVQDSSYAIMAENISLNYGEKQVLDNLNLVVKKGEKILILGASGSGKSSLMSIITGFQLPDKGKLYLADRDRSKLMSMVEQDAFIFSGTLEANLFQEGIQDQKEKSEILQQLGLTALQNQSQSVFERGRNLSGGERKRLSLARGFLRDCEILILDEPLANVDPENIERIEDLILGIRNRTVILISHQVSDQLLSGMDKVYKLKAGKLFDMEVA